MLRERPEKGPHRGNAHGNEDNPLFDFPPEEENGNTVCKKVIVLGLCGILVGSRKERGVSVCLSVLHEESASKMNLAAQVRTIAATPANTPHPMRKHNPHFNFRSMRSPMNMLIGIMAR